MVDQLRRARSHHPQNDRTEGRQQNFAEMVPVIALGESRAP